ncbi:sulfurtransferase [Corynebacterium aquatimens]|uniref:Thiosulfate/3-mercaptopyruvate sulfurtransferase n=1 Tax=Corynebacterium aquatimens TaxID=1190508 RepID=A0A931E4H4_9CORY|nr:sulfurtransferase [Corynebacterium aquatimens]MBG6122951.1 thiosulfate/3-mercaptopyruvate sulfurtransferase [Corynebacterium aquatimens]WJY66714.1 Thiosulfate sulfurtransferase [Corynebacterium aquatimens]
MGIYVPAEELREEIRTGKKLTVLAALWDPRPGRAYMRFKSHHIPTAQFCDPASTLAGMPGSEEGRNPLPTQEQVQKAVNQWGIERDRPVVIYDDGRGFFSARAWWILMWAGITDIRILNGGFPYWWDQGLETVAGPGPITVHSETPVEIGQLPTMEIDQVKQYKGMLIDARGSRRFSGKKEHLDLKAGHIPGAVNIPGQSCFDEHRRILPVDDILENLAKSGITQHTDPSQAVVYSGSGNHSAMLLAAMHHAGLPILTHFIGGWSQWSADHANDIEI